MVAAPVHSPSEISSSPSDERLRVWLLGFRRITTSTLYIPEVDGLRFVALACVFVFHLAGDILRHSPPSYRTPLLGDPIFWLTQRLNFGVQLFFVVSGFVLSLPFAHQYLNGGPAVSLKRYFLRRVTRLEPPYFLALLLFFAVKVAGSRGSFESLLPHLAASVGYVHNLIYATPSDINFVAWSLEIEVQFYLLAPWFAQLLFRPRNIFLRRTAILAAILASAGLPWLLPPSSRVGLSLLGQLAYFLAGVLLADMFVVEGDAARRETPWGDIVCAASVVVIIALLPYPLALSFAAPVTVFAAYYAVFKGAFVRRLLATSTISIVGGMCYSIYLLHNYIVAIAGYFTERVGSGTRFEVRLLIQCVFLGPLVLAISALFYRLIERPCMNPEWPPKLYSSLRNAFGASR